MTVTQIISTISCVFAISIGQLLFKKTSMRLNESDFFSVNVLTYFILAIIIYGLATLFWINLLRFIPLNKAYSFMALSFIFVAIGSYFIFNESISARFFIGLFMIVVGLIVISNE